VTPSPVDPAAEASTSGRGIPARARAALELIPPQFLDDGCSAAPDQVFGIDLRWACRLHDWNYCSRAWPAGTLDQAWRHRADRELGAHVRAVLPLGLRWAGWLFWRATHRFGGMQAFDSCGRRPLGATAAQISAGLCRHGMPMPEWMRAAAYP